MQLSDEPRAGGIVSEERKEDPFLEAGVAEKAAPELGIAFHVDGSVAADDPLEKHVEPLVIASQKIVEDHALIIAVRSADVLVRNRRTSSSGGDVFRCATTRHPKREATVGRRVGLRQSLRLPPCLRASQRSTSPTKKQ